MWVLSCVIKRSTRSSTISYSSIVFTFLQCKWFCSPILSVAGFFSWWTTNTLCFGQLALTLGATKYPNACSCWCRGQTGVEWSIKGASMINLCCFRNENTGASSGSLKSCKLFLNAWLLVFGQLAREEAVAFTAKPILTCLVPFSWGVFSTNGSVPQSSQWLVSSLGGRIISYVSTNLRWKVGRTRWRSCYWDVGERPERVRREFRGVTRRPS